MRDVSIPAWTVLREPSETSGAPSEDELQSRLSSEMVDEIAPASPQRSPEQHKGLDRRPLASGSGDEVAYAQGSSAAVQLRSPAFRKPPSPSCMRRLFPGSDEDEELRPRKKRKRRIVDPEMGLATARTRVSLEGPLPTDGARLAQLSPHVGDASLSTAVDRITLMREARRLRQGTTDSVGLAASGAQSYSKSHVEGRTEKQPIEVGSSYSSQKPIPQVPRSNNAAPLQRAQARRKSSNPSGAVADSSSALSSEAASSSQRPETAPFAPPNHQIIEISDSDDDLPLPARPNTSSRPGLSPSKVSLPRRTKYRAARVPQYKEDDNGVIILTSEDDEPPAPKRLPLPSERPAPDQGPPKDVPSSTLSQFLPFSDLLHVRNSPAEPILDSIPRSASPVPDRAAENGIQSSCSTQLPESEPRPSEPALDREDVEMAEEDPMYQEVLDARRNSPQDIDAILAEPPVPTNVQVPEEHLRSADVLLPPSVVEHSVPGVNPHTEPPRTTGALEESTAVEGASDGNAPSPTIHCPAPGPPVTVEEEPLKGPVLLSASKEDHHVVLPEKPPALSPSSVDMRSQTASPVSANLNPQLQELAISGTPTGRDHSGNRSPSVSAQAAFSPVGSASVMSPSQCPGVPKVRIKGPLYSGPKGFFADVYRLSQKRGDNRTPSQSTSSSSTVSSSSSAKVNPKIAARVSPRVPKVTDVNSPQTSLQERSCDSAMYSKRSTDSVLITDDARIDSIHRREEALLISRTIQAETEMANSTPEDLSTRSTEPRPAGASTGLSHLAATVVEMGTVMEADALVEEVLAEVQAVSVSKEVVDRVPSIRSQASIPAPSDAYSIAPVHVPSSLSPSGPEVSTEMLAQVNQDRKVNREKTPPVGNQPVCQPRTLSQIIRKAISETSRKDVIDLTLDESDNEITSNIAPRQKPQGVEPATLPAPAPGPSSDTVRSDTPIASPVAQPIKTVDLSAIRNIRKLHRKLPQLSPTKPNGTPLPLPGNFGRPTKSVRPSKADLSASAVASPVVQPPASPVSMLPGVAESTLERGIAQSSSTLVQISTQTSPSPEARPKPILPRLRDIMRLSQMARSDPTRSHSVSPHAASPQSPGALGSSVSSRPASPPQSSPSGAEKASTLHDVDYAQPSILRAPLEIHLREASPPRSSSPEAMEDREVEECLTLIYPDTAESTPEVEVTFEQRLAHAVAIPEGRRTRSQADSEASSTASGPRRSARISSSSASSSVEPPERPISRSRHYQPYIRTSSDEELIAQGAFTRSTRHKFLQAFENAGFEAISWKKDRKRIAKEFAPVTQLAKDIPHDLHDRLNSLSLAARRAGNMQVLVFEAEIRANTAEDEPDAPPVYIINEVDDEPTPPLEFYYSNLMWHGEGVPKPDLENLQGCDCIGPCDPASKTCACVKRQRKYWDGGSSGFIYDRKGKLRAHEYPIFECNMNCSCSEDCPNRVIQNGRQYQIAICKTPNKGWGVFAGPRRIPANSYIGIYAGEYLTDSEGEIRGTIYNKVGRTYLFDLDFWFLNDEGKERKVKYCIDAYHAGNFTRYLNHSCDPNCVINACYINEANMDKPLLTIFTCRDVEPFEELCFSYFGQPDDDMGIDTTQKLSDAVYVTCQCGAPNCRGTMWK